jgi:adenylate cyclase class 2
VIDETPIGMFLELEGDAEWIDETARRLGYSPSDYLLESYGTLYLQYCQNRKLEPTNMVFAAST